MRTKLYFATLGEITKVLFATDKQEAKYKFKKYINQIVSKLTDVSKLQDTCKDLLIDSLSIKELKLPLTNTAYYTIKERVLWHNEPGYIQSYSKTFLGNRYGYQVNYNIQLDDGTFIGNSRYDEIVSEATLDPNIKAISV